MNTSTIRALVAEDDDACRHSIIETLAAIGCRCDGTASGREAVSLILANVYDLAVVDLELADGSGAEVMQAARSHGLSTQVVVLTGTLCGVNARLFGLDAGADDYLEKSLGAAEIKARLAARVRRIKSDGRPSRLVWGSYTLDAELLELYETVDGRDVLRGELSQNELRIMHCLMRVPGECVSAEFLARHALRYSALPLDYAKNVAQRIYELRRKLGMTDKSRGIVNVRGEGYALI